MVRKANIQGLGRRVLDQLCGSDRTDAHTQAVVRQGPVEVEVQATDVDRLSLASRRVAVRRTDARPPRDLEAPEAVRGLVRDLPKRLQYLSEPLAAVEIDDRLPGATLRSAPPTEALDGRQFYEVTARDGCEVAITRWQTGRETNRRREADLVLTHDVFAKLVDDLADSLA